MTVEQFYAKVNATAEGRVCANGCRFADSINDFWNARRCLLISELKSPSGARHGDQSDFSDCANLVPLAINGLPYGCVGYQPKTPGGDQ